MFVFQIDMALYAMCLIKKKKRRKKKDKHMSERFLQYSKKWQKYSTSWIRPKSKVIERLLISYYKPSLI